MIFSTFNFLLHIRYSQLISYSVRRDTIYKKKSVTFLLRFLLHHFLYYQLNHFVKLHIIISRIRDGGTASSGSSLFLIWQVIHIRLWWRIETGVGG